MAVIVKYIVVRNGVEKMTFATKKEADAHDKMLDIADNLHEFLDNSALQIDDNAMEVVALFLAEKREEVVPLLRGMKLKHDPIKPGEEAPAPAKNPVPSVKEEASLINKKTPETKAKKTEKTKKIKCTASKS